MSVDTVITNCQVVTTEGTVPAGIAIKDGRIVAIAEDTNLPEAANKIDAAGSFVLPGLIDGHMHLLYPPEDDWGKMLQSETKASAAGGVTTVVHCLFEVGAGSSIDAAQRVVACYKEDGLVDLALNTPIFTMAQIREMRDALDFGMSSFKFLTPYKGREAIAGLPGIDDGILYMGFKEIGKLVKEGYKTFARIHPESIEAFFAIEDWAIETGYDPPTYVDVRPNFIEAEALQRCISLAKVTECPLFVVHQTVKEGPEQVARAKLDGLDIVAETCPQYLVLNTSNTDRMLSKVNPPIRRKEDNEAMWKGVMDGTVNYMGTDHAPVDKSQKGTDFWRAVVGMAGVETWLPIMLSEGVNKGRISLERLVEICSYNVAVKYGLAPKKGMIAVGSDADLVIVDLQKKARVTSKDLYTRADYSNYEGWEFQGWPVLTMLRGTVIAQDRKVTGKPGFGQYVPARVK